MKKFVPRVAFYAFISLSFLSVLVFSLLNGTKPQAAPMMQILNIGNGAEPKDLDPHIVTGIPESNILQSLFEPLVGKDPKTLEPVPAVAETWEISKDAKIFTFKIRSNARWSNGDPLTASDFVYSWTRLLKPETAAEYAYQGYYLKNGKQFNTGKIKDPKLLGVKALDDRTLQITLNNPTPFFLGLLHHHSLFPVHQKTIEKHGVKWTRQENIVSNGPFVLVDWKINKNISVKRNPHYWDKDKVTLEQVNFVPVEKSDTEEKMFRSGELHVTNTLPLEKILVWKQKKEPAYQEHPYLGVYYYWFNVKKAPMNDKKVRKALALSIDRERLIKYVLRGGQQPASAFTPPGAGGFMPSSYLPKDNSRFDEAKKLLAEAGYPEGKGFPTIELLYNTSDSHRKLAEAIQQMWKTNLNVDIKLYNQEWKVYLDTLHTKNYQLARAGWIGDYNDPNTFLDMLVSDCGNNNSGWENATYDKLISEAGRQTDAKKRYELFNQAESLLMDELPVLPIYVYTRVYLKNPNVLGWYPNVEDIHPLKYVSLKLDPN